MTFTIPSFYNGEGKFEKNLRIQPFFSSKDPSSGIFLKYLAKGTTTLRSKAPSSGHEVKCPLGRGNFMPKKSISSQVSHVNGKINP